MEAFVVFIVLGIAFLVQQGRIGRLQRTLGEVIAEVQRQRDVLAGTVEQSAAHFVAPTVMPDAKAFAARVSVPVVPEPEVDVLPSALEPPLPSADAVRIRPTPKRSGFEDIFGSRLPIWAGGVTLAVAGLLLVKYSIDIGLITPAVRVILALVFAALLIAGAEVARRWSATAADPRVSQALAGAGVATAYAAVLMAANLFHLIGPVIAFLGLAAITAMALGLALRFGAPSAVLGLVGGLAAPALVGSKGSIGTLAIYLSLTILGLAGVARNQKWRWLAALALGGGFGWGAAMLVMRTVGGASEVPIAIYLLLLAFAVPFVAGRDARGLIRLVPPALAAVELATLIVEGGFAPLVWAFYGLLAVAVVVLARIDAKQRPLPSIALAVAVGTLALWPHPPFAMLATILLLGGALFAGDAAQRVRTGDARDAGQVAAVLITGFALGYAKLPGMTTHEWAAIALVLAVASLALAATLWRVPRREDGRFAILVATALVLIDLALVLVVGHFWLPPALAAVAAATMAVACWANDRRLAIAARVGLAVAVGALTLVPEIVVEAARLIAPVSTTDFGRSCARYALLGIATALFAWREVDRPSARIVWVLAALLAFVALAQVAPGSGERVALTTALFAGGWVAAQIGRTSTARWSALALTGLGLARTVWFDLGVSNPLWTAQHVGVLPLINLLAPAYLLPLVSLALAVRREPALAHRFAAAWTALQIVLILAFAATSVRQLFHGTLLTGGRIGQTEDIARSLTAIALAVGFLLWGIRARSRAWRITSLVLMLGAVGKVFLFDAAGLDGLLRIASFVALGFSLIGIGWLYSRYLARDTLPGAEGMGIGAA